MEKARRVVVASLLLSLAVFSGVCIAGARATAVVPREAMPGKQLAAHATGETGAASGAAKMEVATALNLVSAYSRFGAGGEDMARRARVEGAVTHLPTVMNHTALPFAPEMFGPFIRILGVDGGVLVGGRAAPDDIAGLLRAMLSTTARNSTLHELAWRLVDTAVVMLDLADHLTIPKPHRSHPPLMDYISTPAEEIISGRCRLFVDLAREANWKGDVVVPKPRLTPKSDV